MTTSSTVSSNASTSTDAGARDSSENESRVVSDPGVVPAPSTTTGWSNFYSHMPHVNIPAPHIDGAAIAAQARSALSWRNARDYLAPCAGWSVFFAATARLSQAALKIFRYTAVAGVLDDCCRCCSSCSRLSPLAWPFSPTFAGVDAGRQRRIVLYILSLIHAAAVTGVSVYYMATQTSSTRVLTSTIPMMFGYFLNDFIATRADWAKYKADFMHHVLAFSILGALMRMLDHTPGLVGVIPPMMVVELSTVFLDIAWLLREMGLDGTWLANACRVAFVLSFFLTRVVWLPYKTHQLRTTHRDMLLKMGRGRYALYLGNVIQCKYCRWLCFSSYR